MLDNEINLNDQVLMARRGVDSLSALHSASSSASHYMPEVPKGGIVMRVCYAGISYAEGYVRKGHLRPKLPGFEVAGVVHDICNSLPNCNLLPGDKVIIYQDDECVHDGMQEFIPVNNAEHVIQIPSNVPMEVASMLPGAALQAYNAVLRAKPHIEKLQKVKATVNVLIVGAGGLGLWVLKLAQYMIGESNSNIRIFIADNSIDKLITAEDEGCCADIIHWCEEDHEQYIIERTLDSCRGGVDVVVDFVSSPRTMMRSLKVLNREGLILVGGNAMSEVSINLNTLAAKQQSIVGIPRGTPEQLRELVEAVADERVKPPCHSVHTLQDADKVLEELAQCRLTGRAILRFDLNNTNTSATADITDN